MDEKREILLDGEKTISVSPQSDCDHFADVIVTAKQGESSENFLEKEIHSYQPII